MLRQAMLGPLVFMVATAAAQASPVLLISIDGLRPADVLDADARGLKIPNLRAFVTAGSYADAVVGVLPTVTYPSHTTLLTGVSPAKHGVVSNTTLDPTNVNAGGWYWYASDIRVPTLWDAAHAKGLTVGNVHWPVSVGAKSITWNLPQIWRTGHRDDDKLLKALATPGLLEPMEAVLGAYASGIDESIEGDENRGRFAARLIGDRKPYFTTVYLTALDHQQHLSGPGSAESQATLERIDAIVGSLVKAELAAHADAVIAIVSDHGFAPTTTELNLFRPFIDAGLIAVDQTGKVTGWTATPWVSGGSIAVVLADPKDAAVRAKVRSLLDTIQAQVPTLITEIVDASTVKSMGGNPEASFFVNLMPGVLAGGFDAKGPLSRPSKYKGMHGYFPTAATMRSTFLIKGPGIARHRSFGDIDMRSISPMLARIMGSSLRDAEKPEPPMGR
jgi:predicted AlkP superfamily pyrophosphatase or phosphodiesterase